MLGNVHHGWLHCFWSASGKHHYIATIHVKYLIRMLDSITLCQLSRLAVCHWMNSSMLPEGCNGKTEQGVSLAACMILKREDLWEWLIGSPSISASLERHLVWWLPMWYAWVQTWVSMHTCINCMLFHSYSLVISSAFEQYQMLEETFGFSWIYNSHFSATHYAWLVWGVRTVDPP